MVDYLESVSLESKNFNDSEYFLDFFFALNNYLGVFFLNYDNILENNYSKDNILIDFKNNIIKFDEEKISKAFLLRSDKEDLIKKKLFQLKRKCLSIKDLQKRAILKARMKKLMELSSNLEFELLQYKISVDLII